MTTLIAFWLLALGFTVGVAVTLVYQWWGDRLRRPLVELDDSLERWQVLNRRNL